MTESGFVIIPDAGGAVCIGADDNRDLARAHQREHRGARVHLREGFVESTGVDFHRDAGGGDPVEGALDIGLDAGEIPISGRLVFHQIRVRERVEKPALGAEREMFEIGALISERVAVKITLLIRNHLHVHGTKHVVERLAGVKFAQPRF